MPQRIDHQGWVEWLKYDFLAWLAGAIATGLVIFIVWLLLQFAAKPAIAEMITVPRACIAVAQQYGMTAPEKMERSEIEQHLNSVEVIAIGVLVPAVRRCRAALKLEMKK